MRTTHALSPTCTTFHRYPIFSTRYSVMCKVYTGYCGTSEIEHGLCACTVDNPLAKARGLSLRIGAQTMLYLSLNEKRESHWHILFHYQMGAGVTTNRHPQKSTYIKLIKESICFISKRVICSPLISRG